MKLSVGGEMPEGRLRTMTAEGVKTITTDSIFAEKRVVLFGVPGAFTPGCSRVHLPGYVDQYEAIVAKGFDTIACYAVNDAYVMHAWGESVGATNKILMLGDGSATYAQAMGLDWDLSAAGMGVRSKRFSIVVDKGIIESVHVDEGAIVNTAAGPTCGL